jgi:exonuclease III
MMNNINNTNNNTHSLQILLPTKQNKNSKLSNILKIATINTQHLTQIKVNDIINLMNEKNIQIMGVSETWLSNKQAKQLFLHEKNYYFTLFHNNTEHQRGIGVGLIIKKNYAQYIYRHESYKGRIVYVDFLFRNKKKLRLIQYYGIPNNRILEKKEERENTLTQLIKIIQEEKNSHHQIILMGDFNLKYEDYIIKKSQNRISKKEINLFGALEDRYNLYDPTQIMFDISPTNPLYTWIPSINKSEGSRIDYFWVSEDITG